MSLVSEALTKAHTQAAKQQAGDNHANLAALVVPQRQNAGRWITLGITAVILLLLCTVAAATWWLATNQKIELPVVAATQSQQKVNEAVLAEPLIAVGPFIENNEDAPQTDIIKNTSQNVIQNVTQNTAQNDTPTPSPWRLVADLQISDSTEESAEVETKNTLKDQAEDKKVSKVETAKPATPPPPPPPSVVEGKSYVRVLDIKGLPKLTLGGIIYSRNTQVALINGSTTQRNDKVAGFTVIAVEARRVHLRAADGKMFYLRLK